MTDNHATSFKAKSFLTRINDGKSTLQCQKHHVLFAQGDAANAVFYIQEGHIKLSVVSQQGKEAVVAILERGGFFGEGCLAEQPVRVVTAVALEECTILRIDKPTMTDALRNDPAFSELFLTYLLSRNNRVQDDLVDQLFNSAEKRLARTLLLLAHMDHNEESPQLLPKISQETLAKIVGTTRSRVSFFMNRFKKLGFIESNVGLHVHRSLLKVNMSSALDVDDGCKQIRMRS